LGPFELATVTSALYPVLSNNFDPLDGKDEMDWFAVTGILVALMALGLLLLSLRRARREAGRFRVLDEVASVSDGADDLTATLDAIGDVLVPRVADFCMIDVTSDRDGASLEPRLTERMDEADLRRLARDPDHLEALRGLGLRSAVTADLRARGRTIGTVSVGATWSRRRYRRHDARFARALSGRIALALDNAGLFSDLERAERERAEIAATLQRGLLPPPLPEIPGWAAAAMYRPAGAENEVGGDFYDAFPISGGWMLVIGDVTGRGAEAASITAQARYTLRTAAWLSGDPLVALATLNSALLARADSALCSVVAFALSSDATQPVRLAVAGHLPPLLVDGDAVTEIAEAGPVLGAFGHARWTLERAAVGPGQQLVAVTDGITEAAGAAERFGETRLRAELAGSSSPATAVSKLEGALDLFTAGALDDDAAALAVTPVLDQAA
jgi:hypothetical protein